MNYLNIITNFLKNIDAANVTLTIVIMVMVIFFTGLIIRFLSKFKGEPVIPSMLSSLGILGTFTGITIGLLNFDTTDIENSVPLLLGGLQSAFITSLAGMGFSILYKILCVTILKNTQFIEDDTSESDVESLAQRLDKLIDQNDKVNINLNNMCDSVDNVVSGVNNVVNAVETHISTTSSFDNVKIGLMKKTNDLMKETNEILNKGPSDEMVNALADAADKFNDVLENQIGKSFKQLNNGVTNLLEWQEQHKSNITALNSMNTALEALPEKLKENVTQSSDIMLKVNNSIIKSEQKLDMHKEESNARITKLNDSLTKMIDGATSNMEQATTAIKQNATNVDNLVSTTTSNVDNLVSHTTKVATNAINTVKSNATESINRNKEDIEGLTKLQKQQTTSMDAAIVQSEKMIRYTEEVHKKMEETKNEQHKKMEETKKNQHAMLDAFGHDVQNIISSMNQQLASLVEHIVDITTKGKTNV